MSTYFDFDAKGDMIPVCCGRCLGQRRIEGYRHVDGGRCFGCGGKGILKMISREEATKIQARRDRDRARRAAKRQAEAEARANAHQAMVEAWRAENAEFVTLLTDYTGSDWKILGWREELVDANIIVPDWAIEEISEKIREEMAAVMPTDGRQQITATLISTKYVENRFGSTVKMLIQCEGYRLWGTRPESLRGVERGDIITMTATVEGKEKGFGFFSRPTRAEIVEAAQAA